MRDPRSSAAKQAWETRRSARYRAGKSEKASKVALASWCPVNGWKVMFFPRIRGMLCPDSLALAQGAAGRQAA
jgi:hypothetical protein